MPAGVAMSGPLVVSGLLHLTTEKRLQSCTNSLIYPNAQRIPRVTGRVYRESVAPEGRRNGSGCHISRAADGVRDGHAYIWG